MKRVGLIAIILVFVGLNCHNAEAGGLSTTFSQVTLEDLELGKTYSTKEVANLPLAVLNTGNESVDLKIELLLPQEQELKEGFEPIPELSWIKLEKTEFKEIKPKELAVTDVLISIPDQKQYQGKNYQVFIWSHTTSKMIGIGLKSKLLIKIKSE